MSSILDMHEGARGRYHECGGTILVRDGGYRCCDRCAAFQSDPDEVFPDGTSRAANMAAYDDGDSESPSAAQTAADSRQEDKRLAAAALVRFGGSLSVRRNADEHEIDALLDAGLIVDALGDDEPRADRRYEATDYARDLVFGRVE